MSVTIEIDPQFTIFDQQLQQAINSEETTKESLCELIDSIIEAVATTAPADQLAALDTQFNEIRSSPRKGKSMLFMLGQHILHIGYVIPARNAAIPPN